VFLFCSVTTIFEKCLRRIWKVVNNFFLSWQKWSFIIKIHKRWSECQKCRLVTYLRTLWTSQNCRLSPPQKFKRKLNQVNCFQSRSTFEVTYTRHHEKVGKTFQQALKSNLLSICFDCDPRLNCPDSCLHVWVQFLRLSVLHLFIPYVWGRQPSMLRQVIKSPVNLKLSSRIGIMAIEFNLLINQFRTGVSSLTHL